MNKNDIKKLNIVSVTSEGFGVAKENEYVYFVPFAIEGEEVTVKILKIKKNRYGIPILPIFHLLIFFHFQ